MLLCQSFEDFALRKCCVCIALQQSCEVVAQNWFGDGYPMDELYDDFPMVDFKILSEHTAAAARALLLF